MEDGDRRMKWIPPRPTEGIGPPLNHIGPPLNHIYYSLRTMAIQTRHSSGDAFNRRFDAILSDFERKERVVDDTLHYDFDPEKHWWRTIDFLTTTGESGIVLNPSISVRRAYR